jgi:hypothetical protein
MEQYMLLKKWILSTLLFLMLNAGSALAAFDVNVKASVSASQVFIGDIFDYSIEIVAPKEAKVNLPSFIGNHCIFKVDSQIVDTKSHIRASDFNFFFSDTSMINHTCKIVCTHHF